MKAGLLVDRMYITLLRKILSEYLHEFNYDDFLLVKEECCAVREYFLGLLQLIFWTCFYFNGGKPPTWSTSPEEALHSLQELYQFILQIWDIFLTSFSFQFVSCVNFLFFRNFYMLQ